MDAREILLGGLDRLQNMLRRTWSRAPDRAKTGLPGYFHTNPRLDPVRVTAKAAASVEWKLYSRKDVRANGDAAAPVDNHELYDLLGNPCPTFPELDGWTLRYLTFAHRRLVGEFFWLKIRDERGHVISLLPVPAAWVTKKPTVGDHSYLVYPYGVTASKAITADPTDIIWFKDPDLSDPYGNGRGSTEAISDEIETDEYAAKYQKNYFHNDAMPPYIITGEGLSDGAAKQIKETILQRIGGWMHAKEPAVIAGKGLTVAKVGDTQREVDMIETRKFLRDLVLQHNQIPPEIYGIIENSNRACYSSDTECLTKNGWKAYGDLTYDDEIATWDTETTALLYSKPSLIVEYDYDGPMHHWKTKNVDVLVTPDHKMYTKSQFKGGFEFRKSEEIAPLKLQHVWRATGGNYSGEENVVQIPKIPYQGNGRRGHEPDAEGYKFKDEQFAEFLGFYISEGNLGYSEAAARGKSKEFAICISQNKGFIADRIREAICALDINHASETICGPDKWRNFENIQFRLNNKSIWHWLKEHVKDGAYNKRLPRCVFSWSRKAQKRLLEALMLGDGSKKQPRVKSKAEYADQFYATASKGLADDVQQLCIQLGLRSSIRVSRKGKFQWYVLSISSKQYYYISTSKIGRKNRAPIHPLSIEDYHGKVWCLEIPSHVFFTRRNGRIACHGNTIDSAFYLFNKNVVSYDLDSFERTVNNQLIALDYSPDLVLRHSKIVQEDEDFALRVYSAGLSGMAITRNEWRTRFRLPELPPEIGNVFVAGMGIVETPANKPPAPPEPQAEPAAAPKAPAAADDGEDVLDIEDEKPEPEDADELAITEENDDEGPSDKAASVSATKAAAAARRQAVWKSFDRKATSGEPMFKRAVSTIAKAQRERVKTVVKAAITADPIPESITTALGSCFTAGADVAVKRSLAPAWLEMLKVGNAHALELLGKEKSHRKEAGPDETWNIWANKWIDEYGLKKAKGINDTTHTLLSDSLVSSLSDSVAAGDSLGNIIKNLLSLCDGTYDDMDKARATTIARTETAGAMNFGSFATYKTEGVGKKEWVATMDEHTRDDHLDADGQVVPIDDAFDVGGDQLMYPGDPSGGPEEVINCRCTTSPVVEDEGE